MYRVILGKKNSRKGSYHPHHILDH